MENNILGIIIIIGGLSYFFKDKFHSALKLENKELPYKKKEFLLNIPERKFFDGLQKIISDEQVVFPQVLLSSIVIADAKGKERFSLWNKINRKTIDFVIFSKPYLTPLLGIEYDGKTHDKPSRKTRDNNINNILNSSGIRCLHVAHKNDIDFIEIKNVIERLLNE